MGFFNKIKDILFEEVEEDDTSSKMVSERPQATTTPIAEKIEPKRVVEERPVVKESVVEKTPEPKFETLNERDLFKSENTFPFPDFDEVEFSNSVSRSNSKPTTNVLEYEKHKKIEKKYDYGRFERIEKTEVVEKKKFKPSPIISPVYGILNEDYRIEDIKDKTEENKLNNETLDFNSVRKKAFGEPVKEQEPKKETFYEETVTVKLKEPAEEKEQKVKTIDELLEDTADITIDTEDTREKNDKDIEIMPEPINSYEDFDVEESIKEDIDTAEEKKEEVKDENEDTLENDLFDLIDSMYDNREDGEY